MLELMLITILCFMAAVFLVAWRILSQKVQEAETESSQVEKQCKQYEKEQERIIEKKTMAEQEANRIFTLYELTQEIVKTFSEEEAFNIFKEKLKENVRFSDCLIQNTESAERVIGEEEMDLYTFPLQWEGKKMGNLQVQGLALEDQEKVMILGHQFALALRRVKLYQEIEKLAITDSLTGLHTRRYFLKRLEEEMARSRLRKLKLSILMIDVDHFKNINDEHGHLTGDQVLCEMGKIIGQNIREIDIAGRYGGEEFAVVLPDTNQEGVEFAAQRIRTAVEKATILVFDASLKTTLSIGMATFPQDGKTESELVDRADWALYRAKKMGRNRVCAVGVYKD